jgi:hypothetical protein
MEDRGVGEAQGVTNPPPHFLFNKKSFQGGGFFKGPVRVCSALQFPWALLPGRSEVPVPARKLR